MEDLSVDGSDAVATPLDADAEQTRSTTGKAAAPKTLDRILAVHVRSWLVKRREIDVKESKYCRYEMLGACNDDQCQSLHVASFTPTCESGSRFACVR